MTHPTAKDELLADLAKEMNEMREGHDPTEHNRLNMEVAAQWDPIIREKERARKADKPFTVDEAKLAAIKAFAEKKLGEIVASVEQGFKVGFSFKGTRADAGGPLPIPA
jgi:hypothetical protein